MVREHCGVDVTVLEKLTYSRNPDNVVGLPADRVGLVVGDICDAGLRLSEMSTRRTLVLFWDRLIVSILWICA